MRESEVPAGTLAFYQQAIPAVPLLLLGFIFLEGSELVSGAVTCMLRALDGIIYPICSSRAANHICALNACACASKILCCTQWQIQSCTSCAPVACWPAGLCLVPHGSVQPHSS